MRIWAVLLATLIGLLTPASAQDEAAPWQATVTGQIEAFRAEDGAAALEFAGEPFRIQFEGQPEAFYEAIIASGYEPIVRSRSHSFGEFKTVTETRVLQVVDFVGPEQGLYQALYELGDEAGEGWRVLGVVLRREAGVGI
jgi:hypothetical protein